MADQFTAFATALFNSPTVTLAELATALAVRPL
jgi:hypothetical protein